MPTMNLEEVQSHLREVTGGDTHSQPAENLAQQGG